MGYSSGSTAALLRAFARRTDNTVTSPTHVFTTSLEAHVNTKKSSDVVDGRLGQLKVVSGGVNNNGEYQAEYNNRFYATTTGKRQAYSNVSVNISFAVALVETVWHFWTSSVAWVRFATAIGDTVAVGSGYPVMPNTVYPFFSAALGSGQTTRMAIIRDTVDGILYAGRIE